MCNDEWTHLSLADREREYSPSSLVPNYIDIIKEYRKAGEKVLRSYNGQEYTLNYGASPRQVIKLFLSEQSSASMNAVFVYIHGGYWQELSVNDSLFPVPSFLDRGCHYAAIGYDLAPAASLSDIVNQIRQALIFLKKTLDADGLRPKIYVSGSSAGAHLAAMMLTMSWKDYHCLTPPCDALFLFSGIYDVRPILGTYINSALKLSADIAEELSPMFLPLHQGILTSVYWGDNETEEFKRQSENFSEVLRKNGALFVKSEIPNRNHFDLVFDLSDYNSRFWSDFMSVHVLLK